MKRMKCTLLMLVVFSTVCSAEGKDKIKSGPVDLTGNWKEARRVSPRGEALDYADTTYYDFLIGNEYTVQRKNSYMYRGTYKATAGTVDLGMRAYNVLEMTPNRMILKDDAGSYQFVRYDKAATMMENNSAAANGERAYKPDVAPGRVGLGQLSGKWEVYKRTSSTTLPEVDYTRIVRVIEVKPQAGNVGTVGSAKDMDGMPTWTIIRYENGVLYCTSASRGPRQLKVVSLKDGDLIVQEDVFTYFFKQFK
jgi:hypothetical protein